MIWSTLIFLTPTLPFFGPSLSQDDIMFNGMDRDIINTFVTITFFHEISVFFHNRTREIRPSGMRGGLAETWAMAELGTCTDRKGVGWKLSA